MLRPFVLLVLGLLPALVSAQGSVQGYTLSQLRRAPRKVAVDARPLSVAPYAYLNLMPQVVLPGHENDPPRTPFHLVLRIAATDSEPLPPEFNVDFAWVSAGGHLWGDTLWASQPDTDHRLLTRTLGGGPQWLMKADSIDVVIRFVRPGRPSQLLRLARLHVETAS